MPCIVVITFHDISENAAGSPRRTNALLDAVPGTPILVQPRRHHPRFLTAPYPVDLGQRKIGINWGIFNLQWPANARVLRSVMHNQVPLILVCSTFWSVLAVRRSPHTPIVLDAHDVNAVYMEQQYGAGHPFTRMVAHFERAALRRVRHVFACSDTDRSEFITRYGVAEDRISVVPNGVDTTVFDGPPPSMPPDAFWRESIGPAKAVLFMGKLDYGPNREALAFIRDRVVPRLLAESSWASKVLIVGGPVPEAAFPPEMVFAGRISNERLATYLRCADIGVAPIFSGSGTRLKIIETLASGCPVVATQKGAEGLGLESGTHAWLADQDTFADAVVQLLNDRDAAARLGDAGRQFARSRFDFRTAIAPKWREVLVGLAPPGQRDAWGDAA